MNSSEPLGLPPGSVRAILTLLITAATLFLFITQAAVPDSLLVINGTVVAFYFGTRNQTPPVENVDPPAIGV